jgi:hypothetical protein
MELPQTNEEKKEMLIEQLLAFGMFKKGEFQLFELPLKELQDEYNKLLETKLKIGEGSMENEKTNFD